MEPKFLEQTEITPDPDFDEANTVVPQQVMDLLNLKDGDAINWIESDGRIYVERAHD